jgi:hypothetical protein
MRKQRIPIVDCTHPEFAAPKMKVPVYGHPNWRMNAHWAECIGGAVGELLSP